MLGIGIGILVGNVVEAMLTSARCSSLLGKVSFGLSNVVTAGVGGGGVTTLIFCFADQSNMAGKGASFGSILSGSTSGSTSVWGASFRRFSCKRLDDGAGSFPLEELSLPLASFEGYKLPLPPDRNAFRSGLSS